MTRHLWLLGAGALVGALGCSFPSQGAGEDVTDVTDVLDDTDLDDTSDSDDPPLVFDADPTAPDAPPGSPDADVRPDATPPFDPATDCPADYVDAGVAGSRHRFVHQFEPYLQQGATDQKASWASFAATCAADAPGLTHLAVPDSPDELEHLADVIGTAEYTYAWTWVGIRRAAGGTWTDVFGEAVDTNDLPTGVAFPVYPNQAAGLYLDPSFEHFNDFPSAYELVGVCECDGRAPL